MAASAQETPSGLTPEATNGAPPEAVRPCGAGGDQSPQFIPGADDFPDLQQALNEENQKSDNTGNGKKKKKKKGGKGKHKETEDEIDSSNNPPLPHDESNPLEPIAAYEDEFSSSSSQRPMRSCTRNSAGNIGHTRPRTK